MTKRKAKVVEIVYPPGFFSEPVRAWRQMRFSSAIRVSPKTKRFETDFERQQRNRDAGGWDAHPLIQPGSRDYVAFGRPGDMERSK